MAKYKVGAAVWVERPSQVSDHRDATYYVQVEVQKAPANDAYTLKIGQRLFQDWGHS